MRLAPVLAVAAIALGGCGGSSPQASSPSTTPKATSTATAALKPAGSTSVSVKNFDFKPAMLRVKAGTKVTWTNGDATNHTVTFSGGGAPTSVDNLAQGASASRTFAQPGTYSYVCTFHPNMKAKVVVAK